MKVALNTITLTPFLIVRLNNGLICMYKNLTRSGISHRRHLSNLPGRSNAGSIKSGRLVAANTYTPILKQNDKQTNTSLPQQFQRCLMDLFFHLVIY